MTTTCQHTRYSIRPMHLLTCERVTSLPPTALVRMTAEETGGGMQLTVCNLGNHNTRMMRSRRRKEEEEEQSSSSLVVCACETFNFLCPCQRSEVTEVSERRSKTDVKLIFNSNMNCNIILHYLVFVRIKICHLLSHLLPLLLWVSP